MYDACACIPGSGAPTWQPCVRTCERTFVCVCVCARARARVSAHARVRSCPISTVMMTRPSRFAGEEAPSFDCAVEKPSGSSAVKYTNRHSNRPERTLRRSSSRRSDRLGDSGRVGLFGVRLINEVFAHVLLLFITYSRIYLLSLLLLCKLVCTVAFGTTIIIIRIVTSLDRWGCSAECARRAAPPRAPSAGDPCVRDGYVMHGVLGVICPQPSTARSARTRTPTYGRARSRTRARERTAQAHDRQCVRARTLKVCVCACAPASV